MAGTVYLHLFEILFDDLWTPAWDINNLWDKPRAELLWVVQWWVPVTQGYTKDRLLLHKKKSNFKYDCEAQEHLVFRVISESAQTQFQVVKSRITCW